VPFGFIFPFLKNKTERHPTTILLSLTVLQTTSLGH
jgi:hypothetical protein